MPRIFDHAWSERLKNVGVRIERSEYEELLIVTIFRILNQTKFLRPKFRTEEWGYELGPLCSTANCSVADPYLVGRTYYLSLKRQCHEIFHSRVFRQSITLRHQMNTLKYFRILFRIRRVHLKSLILRMLLRAGSNLIIPGFKTIIW
jgi:hypothetical protein